MELIFILKTPISFLLNEGRLNSTLNFISSELHEVGRQQIETMPASLMETQMKVHYPYIKNHIITINSAMDFSYDREDIRFAINFTDTILDEVFPMFNNWYIKGYSKDILIYFNKLYLENRDYKNSFNEPDKRDLYKFLEAIEKLGIRSEQDARKLIDVRYFW